LQFFHSANLKKIVVLKKLNMELKLSLIALGITFCS
jgi:hypothetical protein